MIKIERDAYRKSDEHKEKERQIDKKEKQEKQTRQLKRMGVTKEIMQKLEKRHPTHDSRYVAILDV